MTSDILYQIIMVLVAIATLMLIIVLWRLYLVLTDINETTKITKRRANDLDKLIDNLQSSLKGLKDLFSSFSDSFETMQKAKRKIESFLKEKQTKGE